MGLTNFKCVLLTLKGIVQMGLLKDSLSGISCTVQSICVTPCDWYLLLGNMAVESLPALELGRLGLELELQRTPEKEACWVESFSRDFGVSLTHVPGLALPLTNYVTLGKFLVLSNLSFPFAKQT